MNVHSSFEGQSYDFHFQIRHWVPIVWNKWNHISEYSLNQLVIVKTLFPIIYPRTLQHYTFPVHNLPFLSPNLKTGNNKNCWLPFHSYKNVRRQKSNTTPPHCVFFTIFDFTLPERLAKSWSAMVLPYHLSAAASIPLNEQTEALWHFMPVLWSFKISFGKF